MMELSDYRRGLFQWDTGRSLIVTEKDITGVHFQLLPPPSGSTETTDVPVTDGVAQIPDDLLQVGLPLRAYAWGDGYSHYDQTFCVTKREKPTGYASTPADAITLESVQAKLQAEIDGKIQMPDGGDAGDVLKKTGSGVEWGQAAGQSDWMENDETSPGYVKNRPGGYIESTLITVIDKNFQPSDFEASSMGYKTETALQNPIAVDAVYTVKIGNETYTAPSLKFTQFESEMVCIGAIDENKYPDLSKYPFYLGSDAGATEEAWLYLKDAPQSDVSIRISENVREIVKIPAICLDTSKIEKDVKNLEAAVTFFEKNMFLKSGEKEIILLSSTAGSTKKFKITVDDTGTLTATEVT